MLFLMVAGMLFFWRRQVIAEREERDSRLEEEARNQHQRYEASVTEPTLQELLARKTSLPEAVALLSPHMTDVVGNDPDPPAALLAVWMNEHLVMKEWQGVNMLWWSLERMPDNRLVEMLKDPSPYRGRKLCSRGEVIEIYADRSTSPPVYVGGLMTNSLNVVRFIATGRTQGIVKGTQARMCGIFTGLQTYGNAFGGQTSGAFVVGMFE